MPARTTVPAALRPDIERLVLARTAAALAAGGTVRAHLVGCPREVEAIARVEGDRPETVGVIATARGRPGDRADLDEAGSCARLVPRTGGGA